MFYNNSMVKNKFNKAFEKYMECLERQPKDFFSGSKTYELYYLKNNKYRFQEILCNILHSKRKLNILDIGTTEFTFFLKKLFPQSYVYTVDISDRMQKRALAEGITFKKYDITQGNLSFGEIKFDVIIFTEVFEHLFVSPSIVFENLKSLLKSEGLLIFQTPNFARLTNRLKLAIGINPIESIYQMTKFDKVGHGHIREYTLSECFNIISQYKFKILKANHRMYWDYWDIKLNQLIWSKGNRIVIYLLLPSLWLYQLLCFLIPSFRSGISILAHKDKVT